MGVADLNAVEQALRKVENAPLTPEQRKVATHVVTNVDRAVEQLGTDSNLTKAQKMDKAKVAIQELQGLQSQWELSAVEVALKKITDLPRLSKDQRTTAKKVVADVEATVEAVQSGKLTGAARNEQVGLAIKGLQSLEREWLNVTVASKVEALQKELAEKQALLKKDEMELKLAGLEKQLAEKKILMKKLTAEKDQTRDEEKQRKEDAVQEAMIARLVATAKALAAKKAPEKKVPAKAPTEVDPSLAALAAELEAREQNVSASIKRMDVEEKAREEEIQKSIKAGASAPAAGQTDALKKGQKMMEQLVKQEHRKYLKSRVLKEAQREELAEGVRSIQNRDATGLARLMQKMQTEAKSLQAKAKSFLY